MYSYFLSDALHRLLIYYCYFILDLRLYKEKKRNKEKQKVHLTNYLFPPEFISLSMPLTPIPVPHHLPFYKSRYYFGG